MIDQMHGDRCIDAPRAAINVDNVTDLFEVRASLWNAPDDDAVAAVADQYNIPVPHDMMSFDAKARKNLFAKFFELNYPQTATIEEHSEKLGVAMNDAVNHLTREQSQSTLWVFGSYANGKVNGRHSDLDYIMVVPQIDDPEERMKELGKIRGLDQAGYVFSERLGPLDNLDTIMAQGNGLARLYSMTQTGLESEFHVLGEQDLMNIDKLHPGIITRVQPTDPKMEARVSFKGTRSSLPKAGDIVKNYIEHEGEMYKGFFPDQIATGELVYDPSGIGELKRHDAWLAIVKGFIHHRDGYVRGEDGALAKNDQGQFMINSGILPFEDFLTSLYYQKATDYAPQKLDRLLNDYDTTLAWLQERYNIAFI